MQGDQQPADLLDLPFDQYQRYRIAGDTLRTLVAQGVLPAAPRILDVGGYPGLLPRFVDPAAQTVVLDVVPDTTSAAHYGYRYVLGSGMALPFPDESFDCVVSLDTLEHVPAAARPALLAEMRRVGRAAALFIGPVHREETALAEELVFDYIQWLLKAKQEQLAEHRGYGLPDWAATQAAFDAAGWATFTMPAGNLYNWLFMMIAKHYLIQFRDAQASDFERRLDRFYNLTFSATDRQEPAYRGVVVATRTPQPQAFAALAAQYPPVATGENGNTQRLELTGLLLRLFDLRVANHEDRGLREQLTRRELQASALEGKTGLLDRDLHEARGHITNLQAIVETLRGQVAGLSAEQAAHQALQGRHQALVTERTQALTERAQALADRDRIYAEHLRVVAEMERKTAHILYLERLLGGIQAGRVFRATRTVTRLLGRK